MSRRSSVWFASLAALVAIAIFGSSPAQTAFPGLNGRIAYNGSGGIFSVAHDGSQRTRLAKGYVGEPAYSPDGGRIAFGRSVEADDTQRIEVMRSDGTRRRRLTSRDDYDPEWSPDGRSLIFDREHPCEKYTNAEMTCPRNLRRSTNHGIVVYRRGRTRVLTHNGRAPAWSPRGGLIAFTRTRFGVPRLFVMRPDGSGQRRIFSRRHVSPSDVDWSPDGQRLVFGYLRGLTYVIATVRSDGTGFRKLATGGQAPSYSPDGRQIVFLRDSSRHPCFGWALAVMRSDGSHRQLIRSPSGRPICTSYDPPSWQPR